MACQNQLKRWVAPNFTGYDPMIQKLKQQAQEDESVKVFANHDQINTLLSNFGQRIKQIRKLSGAHITVLDPQGDNCLQEIIVSQGHGPNCAVDNAIWLMNVCINAFTDSSASLCHFDSNKTSLIDVVLAGSYGRPVGLNLDHINKI